MAHCVYLKTEGWVAQLLTVFRHLSNCREKVLKPYYFDVSSPTHRKCIHRMITSIQNDVENLDLGRGASVTSSNVSYSSTREVFDVIMTIDVYDRCMNNDHLENKVIALLADQDEERRRRLHLAFDGSNLDVNAIEDPSVDSGETPHDTNTDSSEDENDDRGYYDYNALFYALSPVSSSMKEMEDDLNMDHSGITFPFS